jgi:hypothetical protein
MWMPSTRCFGGGCAVPDDVPDEERSGRLTPTLGHRCLVPDQPADRGLDAVHLL